MAGLSGELSGRAWLVGAGPEILDAEYESLRRDAEAAVSHLSRR